MTATVYIALTRAVMPTGKNKVPMAALRRLLDDLGFEGARTLLASGNALFRTQEASRADLEALLESEIARRIGPQLDVMVRDAAAWSRIAAGNPFPAESEAMPSRVLATVFKEPPSAAAARAFEAAVTGPEQARIVDDVAWIVYRDGVAGSKLTPAFFKQHLGDLRGTARNWNTVRKLDQLAAEMALDTNSPVRA